MAFLEDVVAAFPEYQLDPATARWGASKLAVAGTLDGKSVMLKILKEPIPAADGAGADDEPEALLGERFKREVVAMRKVKSPRVVSILKGPEVRKIGGNDHLWYVEPRFTTTLSEHLDEDWQEPRIVALIEELLEGLVALQDQRIVHRDVKPTNIGVDVDGKQVLLDLGAALFTELTTYTIGIAPHTRQFAAPEQLYPRRRGFIDIRTDLFAVGIIAFRVLTKRHPFGEYAADAAAFERRLVAGTYDRDALKAAPCSDELKGVIDRLLQPRQNQRFRNARQLRAALQRCKR